MWLQAFDFLFTLLHFAIIGFNLLGWIWRSARKLHFYSILITAFSWLILGLWFGIGYCPVTDWQWQVKNKLGEKDLPASFIKYVADKLIGGNVDSVLIDYVTALSFGIVVLLSVYFNFINKKIQVNRLHK